MDDRLSGSLDAVLHLLDRQVVDADDRLVCKVDDVELTEYDDGVLGVTGLLSGIFTFAVSERIRADNPVRGVRRYADGKSERSLNPSEIAALGKALETYERNGGNPAVVAIIRLLIFTGARRSEIAALRWDEVDFSRDVIVLRRKESVLSPGAAAFLAHLVEFIQRRAKA